MKKIGELKPNDKVYIYSISLVYINEYIAPTYSINHKCFEYREYAPIRRIENDQIVFQRTIFNNIKNRSQQHFIIQDKINFDQFRCIYAMSTESIDRIPIDELKNEFQTFCLHIASSLYNKMFKDSVNNSKQKLEIVDKQINVVEIPVIDYKIDYRENSYKLWDF